MRKLTRRLFLRGVVATAALVSISAATLQRVPVLVEPAREWAIERLRTAWLAFYREHGRYPKTIVVGRDFYDAFAGELQAHSRWITDVPVRWLCFKSSRVTPRGRGYRIHEVA